MGNKDEGNFKLDNRFEKLLSNEENNEKITLSDFLDKGKDIINNIFDEKKDLIPQDTENRNQIITRLDIEKEQMCRLFNNTIKLKIEGRNVLDSNINRIGDFHFRTEVLTAITKKIRPDEAGTTNNTNNYNI
ncbi:hypothetical protein [Candidatus Vampirococcus lugosii]|nr:hypothetical protein [Candidatus Vampirococcus lugosii]